MRVEASWEMDVTLAAEGRHATLAAFARALGQEAHNLARWPQLTRQQLSNRLQWDGAAQPGPPPAQLWLRPRARFRESETLLRTLTHEDSLLCCALSPDGSLVAAGTHGGEIVLWNTRTGEHVLTFEGHSDAIWDVAFSRDGSIVVSASDDRTVGIWNSETGARRATLSGHGGQVRGCATGPDGGVAVSSGADWLVAIWSVGAESGLRILAGPHSGPVRDCAISPDGGFVVSASEDTTLKTWDVETGAERGTLAGHTAAVTSCAVSPDGSIIVSGSEDYTLRIWGAEAGEERATLEGHRGPVQACAISPDGSFVVSASADNTVKVWSVPSPESEPAIEPAGRDRIPDASGSAFGPWADVWTQQQEIEAIPDASRTTFEGHALTVSGCAVSPDATFVASSSFDRTVKLWDVRDEAAP